MTTIELTNGYYIEVDDMCATMKQWYKGKTKDGKERDAEKICGYYSNVPHALKHFVRLNQIDSISDFRGDLDSYVKTIEEINNKAVKAIESVMEGTKGNECFNT